MFRGLFAMNAECDSCGLKYERDPGYFLGSTYINYMLTAIILTVGYVTLHFGRGLSNRALTPWLLAFCVLFPLWFHRHSRGLWQALDSWFDTQEFWADAPSAPLPPQVSADAKVGGSSDPSQLNDQDVPEESEEN